MTLYYSTPVNIYPIASKSQNLLKILKQNDYRNKPFKSCEWENCRNTKNAIFARINTCKDSELQPQTIVFVHFSMVKVQFLLMNILQILSTAPLVDSRFFFLFFFSFIWTTCNDLLVNGISDCQSYKARFGCVTRPPFSLGNNTQ